MIKDKFRHTSTLGIMKLCFFFSSAPTFFIFKKVELEIEKSLSDYLV